ncbi:restriction endonuclease [Streptomyces sp. BE20]|uniref:restriction endonuclease n=1 Tax=unclassified Streptomyces TaxID=2593676 RepID=UPI002E782134|nr:MULTISPECIES: restriction endonuclease [unclassified Streptomyces]MED7955050.1 restriction endonuclease [Streptomyces sp. BE303]MEE1821155.1 restriction endonuclease [Streptomyces sp. BE20]
MEDRRRAGLLFEPFLNELFRLFDLDPRLSYVLETEQIDGSFFFDTDDYIVEAKWWKKAMGREHVDIFDAKVRRKGRNALGLYIAVNGFTADALKEYDRRTAFITMDGGDPHVRVGGPHPSGRPAQAQEAPRERDAAEGRRSAPA